MIQLTVFSVHRMIESILIKGINVHNIRDCGNLSHPDPSHGQLNKNRPENRLAVQLDSTFPETDVTRFTSVNADCLLLHCAD